jgi:hypothetical protein
MRRWLCIVALSACAAPPATPPVPMPPLADVVKTCAFEVSCLTQPITTSMQTCVNAVLGGVAVDNAQYRRWVQCAAAASDCTTVLRCASLNHDPNYCAAHPDVSCDGDVIVPCASAAPFDWAIFSTDCAALGMHCAAVGGNVVCTDGVSCDPQALPAYCDGNSYVKCDKYTHLRYSLDCRRSGIENATCRGEPNSVGCFPTGPPCQSTADRCDGNVRVRCIVDEEFRLVCPQRCDNGSCVEDGPACPSPAPDACSGAAITTCANSTLVSIDCAALGFSTCTAGSNGDPLCR